MQHKMKNSNFYVDDVFSCTLHCLQYVNQLKKILHYKILKYVG